MRRLVLLGFVAALCGCPAVSLRGGSRTLPKGEWEVSAMAGGSDDCVGCASFQASARRGLSDRIDLGLHLFTMAAALEGRFQIYESAPEDLPALTALVSAAGGVRAGYIFRGDVGRFGPIPFGELGVVLGVRAPRFVEFVIAPRALFELVGAFGVINAGGSFAIVVHLPRRWSVAPQVTAFVPVFPPSFPQPRVHLGVGVMKSF